MASATVKGGVVVKAAAGSTTVAALTPNELAAANQALASLNINHSINPGSALLSAPAADTFAGGATSVSRLVAGFGADTLGGGMYAASNPAAMQSLALSANPLKVAGPSAAGLKAVDPTTAPQGMQVVTLADQTSIQLLGVNAHNTPNV